jgi:hypothetical protein
METQKVFDFADIFRFAENEYGIGWNPCNDVFFGNSLEYGKHSTVYPLDWAGYVSFDDADLKDKASDYTREEVEKMDDIDKSYVILSAYFESLNIDDDEVLVNCG